MPIVFYHLLWTIVFIFLVPIFPLLLLKKRFCERLAFRLPQVSLRQGNIWIHALSVGEVISALPLVDAIGLKYPDTEIVFTVATSKGMAVAQKKLDGKVRILLTMPVDFWWCIRRIVNYIKPSVFILVETDIWPGLIAHLRRRGLESILVNGRVSPGTYNSYRSVPCLVKKMFEPLELCLMQSDLDSERLLGVGIAREKIVTVGNIKFDRDWVPMNGEERGKWLTLLGLEAQDPVWVAGSTHPGEDDAVLEVFKKLRFSFDSLRLILAPRRIEQACDIRDKAQHMGLNAVLKTELSGHKRPYEVLVLNTLGELRRIYGIGRVSFVGGSLVPMGGHNLLESAGFGCPVLFGPYTHNFFDISESLLKAGGGWRVKDRDELYEAVKMLLTDENMRAGMGRLAKEFVEKNGGALELVMSYIGECMNKSGGLR